MERIFDVEQQYPDTEFKKYIHVSKLGIDSRLYNSYEACPDTIRLIVNSLEVYPTDSVVDIGCGKGYAMYAMAQKNVSYVLAALQTCTHCPLISSFVINSASHMLLPDPDGALIITTCPSTVGSPP